MEWYKNMAFKNRATFADFVATRESIRKTKDLSKSI
jgi:hypothetical protein